MKRDWDVIRNILIKVEQVQPEKGCIRLSDFPSKEDYKYSYHVELLIEAGLISGNMSKTLGVGASEFLATRLTWDGHEFIDAVRSDTVWNKARTHL